MPHARRTGTAWDRRKEDYAHTRDIDRAGWAWEFLRRNHEYRKVFQQQRPHCSVATNALCGFQCHCADDIDRRAMAWGLLLLVDPEKLAHEADLFWSPELVSLCLKARVVQLGPNTRDGFSLLDLACRVTVLRLPDVDHVVIQQGNTRLQLTINGRPSFERISGFKIEIDGIAEMRRAIPSLQVFLRLQGQNNLALPRLVCPPMKWLDYLIALDGHQEGWTYRDIAEVLYGSERVGTHWMDDTRWMKSKVRRAVERGIQLMNGGYRELL